jgi:hypothetical protein
LRARSDELGGPNPFERRYGVYSEEIFGGNERIGPRGMNRPDA